MTHASAAKSALDRIVIPQEVLDRIASTASPRSSLIISDEALSPETGKGTEFVAVLSSEPQGGLAMRRAHGGDRIPLRAPARPPILLALALRGSIFHLVMRSAEEFLPEDARQTAWSYHLSYAVAFERSGAVLLRCGVCGVGPDK